MDANNVYNTAIKYIEKLFYFIDQKYETISHLSMPKIPKFQVNVQITNAFNITIDQDLLLEEYISVKTFIADITDSERQLPCDERWVCYFKQNSSPQF